MRIRASGVADLPLHGGHVPPWLIRVMKELSEAILKVMTLEYTSTEILKRFSNPLWFQAFSNAIGMDWDSSGSTTVTTAMIKEALTSLNAGVRAVGGKGRASLKTLAELEAVGSELSLTSKAIERLKEVSRLSAKVDTVLLQDGFKLYHHSLIISERGEWVVIQQGMDVEAGLARRYHLAWLSSENLLEEPHSGIASDELREPLNLTAAESSEVRNVIKDLMNEHPKKLLTEIKRVNAYLKGNRSLLAYASGTPKIPGIPYYKPVRLSKSLLSNLNALYEAKPANLKEALLIKGSGPEVLRALALISDLIYREPPSLKDPVTHPFTPFKYAYTIGGKDGIPYPVRKDVAEAVIKELVRIVKDAELGSKERLKAFKALKAMAPEDIEIPV